MKKTKTEKLNEEPLYRNRKPDKETELIRMWSTKTNSKESKDIQKRTKDNSFKIKYKDMEIEACGFTILTHKETKKLMFAYKFKHDERFIIYYIPEENKNNEDCKKAFEIIKMASNMSGYNLQDMRENLKSIYEEFQLQKKEIKKPCILLEIKKNDRK